MSRGAASADADPLASTSSVTAECVLLDHAPSSKLAMVAEHQCESCGSASRAESDSYGSAAVEADLGDDEIPPPLNSEIEATPIDLLAWRPMPKIGSTTWEME